VTCTATMSTPLRPGQSPAVVLLTGSGPLDRVGTIGPNKPLKDLASSLATLGIALLRSDKVTFAHGDLVSRTANLTFADEHVPAALAAIGQLSNDRAVDPGRIFIAGHSLGGTVAPRVAATADRSVAGLALLAAGAAPLHRAMVRQLRYLASLDRAAEAVTERAIAVLERQADLVDSEDLCLSTPRNDLPLGAPASYWLEFRDYDPVATAASLNCPVLAVQGGRDYHSTVPDDFARWQSGLADRPEVTVRYYPSDNHLFARPTGRAG